MPTIFLAITVDLKPESPQMHIDKYLTIRLRSYLLALVRAILPECRLSKKYCNFLYNH